MDFSAYSLKNRPHRKRYGDDHSPFHFKYKQRVKNKKPEEERERKEMKEEEERKWGRG